MVSSTVTVGQSELSPVSTSSGCPSDANVTWRQGSGSSQLSVSVRYTFTTTVPARIGLCWSVPLITVPPAERVSDSPLTVWLV